MVLTRNPKVSLYDKFCDTLFHCQVLMRHSLLDVFRCLQTLDDPDRIRAREPTRVHVHSLRRGECVSVVSTTKGMQMTCEINYDILYVLINLNIASNYPRESIIK